MDYDNLLKLAAFENIEVYETNLSENLKGIYLDSFIAINSSNKSTAEKKCILAEELGHYHTTVGDILDQAKTKNRKQEYKARRWAVLNLIRVEQFVEAFNKGVRNRAELAEFLEITESFLEMSLGHFKGIYGVSCSINDYIIYFDPLHIYKKV